MDFKFINVFIIPMEGRCQEVFRSDQTGCLNRAFILFAEENVNFSVEVCEVGFDHTLTYFVRLESFFLFYRINENFHVVFRSFLEFFVSFYGEVWRLF